MTESTPLGEPLQNLLHELRSQGIRDERVLQAIARVPRERFVPEAQQDQAWANVALPIGAGQTISQPYIVALMSQALRLKGHERVLEIGTGSGYQAAVLALLAAKVISVERHASLARSAGELLRELGFTNIEIHVGDGTLGWPPNAPYDGVLITAGAPRIPGKLLDQLSQEHGRLVIPVGTLDDQRLIAIERTGNHLNEEDLGPVRFVPLVGRGAWGTSTENGHQM